MAERELEQIEKPQDLVPGEGVSVDKDTKYEYGADLQTDGTPIMDPGTGKTITLRVFEFAVDPRKVLFLPTDKQKIFNDHSKLILTQLWADGLRPYEGASPRVIISKDRLNYKIIVPAEARLNMMFVDRPHNLTDMLSSTSKKKNATPRHRE